MSKHITNQCTSLNIQKPIDLVLSTQDLKFYKKLNSKKHKKWSSRKVRREHQVKQAKIKRQRVRSQRPRHRVAKLIAKISPRHILCTFIASWNKSIQKQEFPKGQCQSWTVSSMIYSKRFQENLLNWSGTIRSKPYRLARSKLPSDSCSLVSSQSMLFLKERKPSRNTQVIDH